MTSFSTGESGLGHRLRGTGVGEGVSPRGRAPRSGHEKTWRMGFHGELSGEG